MRGEGRTIQRRQLYNACGQENQHYSAMLQLQKGGVHSFNSARRGENTTRSQQTKSELVNATERGKIRIRNQSHRGAFGIVGARAGSASVQKSML